MGKQNEEAVNLERIRGPFVRHLKQVAASAGGRGHVLSAIETHVDINGYLCAGYKEDNPNKKFEELIVYPINEV